MEMPEFPLFAIELTDKSGDLVSKFLSIRPSERWVLVSKDAIFSQQQLWTAWLFSERNFHRENNLARTIDAEFLRYIAGTHHVSEAVRRVGYSDENDSASIVFLPASKEENQQFIPEFDSQDIGKIAEEIISQLGASQTNDKYSSNFDFLPNMGISINGRIVDDMQLLINHIISADIAN